MAAVTVAAVTMTIVFRIGMAILVGVSMRATVVSSVGIVRGKPMIMAMPVVMTMAMMRVSKSEDSDKIDEKTQATDGEELAQLFDFATASQSLRRFKDDLDADEPMVTVSGRSILF